MTSIFRPLGIFAATGLLVLSLGGCSGYDVELKGGIFDVAGLSSIGKKTAEPKMKKRNTLVVPPTTASLPVPGSGEQQQQQQVQTAAANGEAWPVDPEKAEVKKKAELAAKHKEFCEAARRRYEAGLEATLATGPLGSCQESILRNFTGKGLLE